jgi:uncharacterized membrane protein YfhO
MVQKLKILSFGTAVHLMLFTVLGPWFRHPLPIDNDNLNLSLPNQFLFSSGLRSGIFTLWDPYSSGGTPFNTVYAANGLNPFLWLLSIIGVVNFNIFVIEIYFYCLLAFVGMYLWLKSSLKSQLYQVLGALTFSLSPIMIFQSYLNLEAAVTAATIPWIFLGLQKINRNEQTGVYIVAAAAGLALTGGYLGLNLILFYAIALFLTLHVLSQIAKNTISRDEVIRIGYALTKTLILVVGIFALPLMETWVNFRVGFARRDIDPYDASLQFESILSLVFPGKIDLFTPNSNGAFQSGLFIPTVLFVGFFGIQWRKLSTATISIFCASGLLIGSLSSSNPITIFIVDHVPGLRSIRFHSWSAIIILFFIITAAISGLENLSQNGISVRKFLMLGFGLIVLMFLGLKINDSPIIQIVVLVALVLTAIFVSCLKHTNIFAGKIPRMLFVISVLQVSFYVLSFNNPFPQYHDVDEVANLRDLVSSGETGFDITSFDQRADAGLFLKGNESYFRKIPSVNSYFPSIHPVMRNLLSGTQAESLKYFLTDQDFKEIPVQITKFQPNSMSLIFDSTETDKSVLVLVPYSTNWRALVDGSRTQILRSKDGLVEMVIQGDATTISLEYSPWYWKPLICITFLSWVIIGIALSKGLFRKPVMLIR